MKFFGREIEGFSQALVMLVAVLLVSSGLCGAQWAIVVGTGNQSSFVSGLFMITGVLELGLMLLSALGIVVVLIAWLASVMYQRFAKPPKDSVQRLFEDADDEDKLS